MDIQDLPAELAIVRLTTLYNKSGHEKKPRLVFATVTLLPAGRMPPPEMSRALPYRIKKGATLYFKRVVMRKDAAIEWYLSLQKDEASTPLPENSASLNPHEDNTRFALTELFDDKAWPTLSLPIDGGIFSDSVISTDPAPFIGNQPGRLHRKFGFFEDTDSILADVNAVQFIARHMHINLRDYPEYFGSAAFVSPEPLLRSIESFMVPAQGGKTERIIYLFVPKPGQTVKGVKVTTFDVDSGLLTDFQTYVLDEDGILDLEKGICDGQYGFVAHHPVYGLLTYHPLSGFTRRISMKMGISSGERKVVSVPMGDASDSSPLTYHATQKIEYSESLIGDKVTQSEAVRGTLRSHYRRRQREKEAERFKQHWFEENAREDAMRFFHRLMAQAQRRVIIADPFFQNIQLAQYLYAVHPQSVSVTILTTKKALNEKSAEKSIARFRAGLAEIREEHKINIQAFCMPRDCLHDRFIVIDDEVWLSGNSLNSVGVQSSMIVTLPEPASVIKKLIALAEKSRPLSSITDEEIASET